MSKNWLLFINVQHEYLVFLVTLNKAHMKKIVYTALAGVVSFCISCNGGSNNESSATDTSASTADTTASAPMASAPMTKTLELTGAEEVPANKSTGKGTAEVSYNKDTKTLSYSVNYSGLTGDATMAHIHGTAPKGQNAGPKVDLSPLLKKGQSGSFMDSVKVGDQIKEDSLLSGMYYINIHTKKNPGGEIRAQIEF
jgi:hypothetical protein